MPRTTAQIEAARRNGARSRGPVSLAGRAVSAGNALKHGLCAREVRLPRLEDQAQFIALRDAFVESYRPEDAQEMELVCAIAVASWQVRRAQDLEMQYWDWTYAEIEAGADHHLVRQLDMDEQQRRRTVDTILRYAARAESSRSRSMRELMLYRSGRLHRAEDAQDMNGPKAVRLPVPSPVMPVPLAAVQDVPADAAASSHDTNEPEAAATRQVRPRPRLVPKPVLADLADMMSAVSSDARQDVDPRPVP